MLERSNKASYQVERLISTTQSKFFYSQRAWSKRLLRRANVERDAKNYPDAARLYEAVLVARPTNGHIHVQCGHMHKESGSLERAEAHYLQARVLMPADSDLSLQLGHLYKISGRPYEALGAYQRAASLSPGWQEPLDEIERLRGQLQTKLADDKLITAAEDKVIPAYRQPELPEAPPVTDIPSTQPGAPATNLPPPGTTLSAEQIRASGLFDASWYLRRYGDIAVLGIDPLQHYANDGIRELRAPGPGFQPHWYRTAYPEAEQRGLDPFTHYILVGRAADAQPVPALYPRWIEAFDTLTAADRHAAEGHIAAATLAKPDVIVAVNDINSVDMAATLRALRGQWLTPASVTLCLTPDCGTATLDTLRALVGSDPLFKLADKSARRYGTPVQDHPVILMDAGIQLREHAFYMFVQARAAGTELIYADEDRLDEAGLRCKPFFKPDPSPELSRQTAYLGSCVLLGNIDDRAPIVADIVAGRTTVAQIARRAFTAAKPDAVLHIPFVLYHDLLAPRPAPRTAPAPVLDEANLPSVSIIIPTRDKVELLRSCVESLRSATDYPLGKIEVIVVDNRSIEQDTHAYFENAAKEGKLRVIQADFDFNYSRLNNLAAGSSTADLLVLLNNDTEILDPLWLRTLAAYAMQTGIGAVGPKLLYEDGTIQHAGVVLSIGGVAAHAHLGLQHDEPGTYGFAQLTREVAVVTGACLVIRRDVFTEVGGFDEALPVAFNDVLLCLACLDRGYRNLYVATTWVRHLESKTRGTDDTPEKVDIFLRDARYARAQYPKLFRADPYYNPNLDLQLEEIYQPAFPPRCQYPWKRRACKQRQLPKLLLASPSFSSDNELGAIASMHASYLSSLGYDVIAGAPQQSHYDSIGAARFAILDQAEAAAAFAAQNDVDCIVVYGWPFLKVARLLGDAPSTMLYRHEDADRQLISTPGDRRNARIEHELSIDSFTAVLASSHAILTKIARPDGVVCLPGGDRLGRWSPEKAQLRQQIKSKRHLAHHAVIVVGGLPAQSPLIESMLDFWEQVATRLRPETTRLFVVNRSAIPPANAYLTILDRPSAEETAGLFVAADIYIDLSTSGTFSLDAAESASLGAHVMPIDAMRLDASRPEDMVMRLAKELSETRSRHSALRTSHAVAWADTLPRFRKIIDQFCGHPASSHNAQLEFLSNRMIVNLSGLFDEAHYLTHYSNDATIAQDALGHYIEHGWRTRQRPSALFHSDWFVARYPEIGRQDIDVLAFYLRQPAGPFDPNPFFSNAAYIAANPTAPEEGLAPLVHYLRNGVLTGKSYVGPDFDSIFYADAHSGLLPKTLDPLVHFLRFGKDLGFLATKPKMSRADPYDTSDLERVLGSPIIWKAPIAAGVTNKRTAAQFCIELLSKSSDVREKYPTALSDGASGDFARWLTGSGAKELGLSSSAQEVIKALFETDMSARVMQLYLQREDLLSVFPFALLPGYQGEFLAWLYREEVKGSCLIELEELRWFAICQAEQPAKAFVTTYRFKQMLQMQFPDGLTVFGKQRVVAWLKDICGFGGRWLDQDEWPVEHTAAEQIRIAYAADASWQEAHPAAFESRQAARTFLEWLVLYYKESDAVITQWLRALDFGQVSDELAVGGINMLGHFCYPSGLRTSTEFLVDGLRKTGARASVRDVWVQPREAEAQRRDYGGLEVYDTTIIHTQPEPFFDVAYMRGGLAPRSRKTYRIGYWYWELDTVPLKWRTQARQVDEIWTATRFVGDALRSQLSNPVHEIMPGLELPKFKPLPRSHYNLPDKKFLFLFTFHMASIMERKNPLGLIAAFKLAFPNKGSVGLVLKTSFGKHHPAHLKEIQHAAADSDIVIIDEIYTQDEVLSLMQACDAYISLHRSEGYGLTMAEAMLLGKPVIATNYSGNLDFMSTETGLLVDYKLVTLDRPYGPYDVGTRWAEPSTHHAAECMRRVVNQSDWARDLGKRAQKDLQTRMSLEASGKRMAARLAQIKQMQSAL